MHWPINDHCTLVMVLSNTQSLFWIWASKLLLWRRFNFAFLGQKKKTEMGMVDFSFSPQKVWNLDVSISSRIMRFVCKISLSLLETRENTFGFLFSSRNWRKYLEFLHFFAKILVLFSNQKTDLDISLFSSRNSRCGFHISLSLLDLTFWHLVNAWLIYIWRVSMCSHLCLIQNKILEQ